MDTLNSSGRPPKEISVADVKDWLVDYIAELKGIEKVKVHTNIAFDRYGLDSATAVAMSGDLMDWCGKEIDPSALYEYRTISELAAHVAGPAHS